MDTYLLTGNPEKKTGGMSVDEYETICRQVREKGYADALWTMKNTKSNPGDQVVLLRQGRVNSGIIAFGHRVAGDTKPGEGNRKEYPIRFCNTRSIHDDPYISTDDLKKKADFWSPANFPAAGTQLTEKQLLALEELLGVSLSTLCTGPYEAKPSDTKESNPGNGGPTTGPIPSPWAAHVEHNINTTSWTYALRFGDYQLWKVGHAEDLEVRLNDVKRHVPEEILDNKQWRIAFRQRWEGATPAYEMEQKVFELLADRRTIGERIRCSEKELKTAWEAAFVTVRAKRRPFR